MKKRTIGIGIKQVTAIYRDGDSLKEEAFEFAISTTHAESLQIIQEKLCGRVVEAMKSKDIGIRKKYQLEEGELLKLLEEAGVLYE